MNLSHYLAYYRDSKDFGAFNEFVDDTKKIVALSPYNVMLSGRHGEGEPIIDPSMVLIGSIANTDPFSHLRIRYDEPFPAARYPMIMVNTKGMAYDITIRGVLLAFVSAFPMDSRLTSDGDDASWRKAMQFFELATDKEAPQDVIKQRS